MSRLSNAQVAWWDAQPEAQTCSRCGTAGSKATVQPQYRPKQWAVLCGDCINAINVEIRTRNAAALAAAPRCEVPGCGRRGAWHVGTGRTLLCGTHKRRSYAGACRANAGNPFGIFVTPPSGRDIVLAWAMAS
jgi:hypothetical protein